jgi:hypothetical protein
LLLLFSKNIIGFIELYDFYGFSIKITKFEPESEFKFKAFDRFHKFECKFIISVDFAKFQEFRSRKFRKILPDFSLKFQKFVPSAVIGIFDFEFFRFQIEIAPLKLQQRTRIFEFFFEAAF